MNDHPRTEDSFTQLAADLALGLDGAAREVWTRYAERLVSLARKNLSQKIRQKEDPDDVVQSALKSFYRRQAAGGIQPIDWDGLWAVLVVITLRKCRNRARTYRAGQRDAGREESLGQVGDALALASAEPTPLEAAALSDLVTNLMAYLKDDRERAILSLTLQGFTASEVGAQVNRTRRTVHRVLERLRGHVTRILEQVDDDDSPIHRRTAGP